MKKALEMIRWMAQTVHQAYHQEQSGTFESCPKDICSSAKRALECQCPGPDCLVHEVSEDALDVMPSAMRLDEVEELALREGLLGGQAALRHLRAAYAESTQRLIRAGLLPATQTAEKVDEG